MRALPAKRRTRAGADVMATSRPVRAKREQGVERCVTVDRLTVAGEPRWTVWPSVGEHGERRMHGCRRSSKQTGERDQQWRRSGRRPCALPLPNAFGTPKAGLSAGRRRYFGAAVGPAAKSRRSGEAGCSILVGRVQCEQTVPTGRDKARAHRSMPGMLATSLMSGRPSTTTEPRQEGFRNGVNPRLTRNAGRASAATRAAHDLPGIHRACGDDHSGRRCD